MSDYLTKQPSLSEMPVGDLSTAATRIVIAFRRGKDQEGDLERLKQYVGAYVQRGNDDELKEKLQIELKKLDLANELNEMPIGDLCTTATRIVIAFRRGKDQEGDLERLKQYVEAYVQRGNDDELKEKLQIELKKLEEAIANPPNEEKSPLTSLITHPFDEAQASIEIGSEITPDLQTKMDQILQTMFPDGNTDNISIIPHAQSLAGGGSIFIIQDNTNSLPKTSFVKVSPSSMEAKRDTLTLELVQNDFNAQFDSAGDPVPIEASTGSTHNANTMIEAINIDVDTKAIVMDQVLDVVNLFSSLKISTEKKHQIINEGCLQLINFMSNFLKQYADTPTLPKDWGLETKLTRSKRPEFKGVGFFPDSVLTEPKLGFYDFSTKTDRLYHKNDEHNFLFNIPAFILSINGFTDDIELLFDSNQTQLNDPFFERHPSHLDRITKKIEQDQKKLITIFTDLGFPNMMEAINKVNEKMENATSKDDTKECLTILQSSL